MAYKTEVNGKPVWVDTLDELKALLEIADGPSASRAPAPPSPASAGRSQDRGQIFLDFYKSIDDPNQQKLLRILAGSPTGVSDERLRDALSVSSNVDLRGLLIGLSRRAKNRGLSPKSVIKREVTRTNGGKKRTYRFSLGMIYWKLMNERGWTEG